MKRFPPSEDQIATLENWRKRPFSAWSFHNVRELIPTSEISNNPSDTWELGLEKKFPEMISELELTNLATDAVVVIHKGSILFEKYLNGMAENHQHILFSVSKSILGLLFGILEREKLTNTDSLIKKYIPEIENTAYEGATIRNCLDMEVGVHFDEDYFATSGPIIDYRYAANWNPTPKEKSHLGLRSFIKTLTKANGPHGQKFHYVSPNTDLLGWVVERATGTKYSTVLSKLLWQPLGAEYPGYLTVDRSGAPRAAGGKCFAARDLARVGMLMCNNGARGRTQIVPDSWIEDIFTGGNNKAWDSGDMAVDFPGKNIAYRSKWYSHKGKKPMVHGIGIHGQYLFVDRQKEISISWFSSDNDPLNKKCLPKVLNIVNRIRNQLD